MKLNLNIPKDKFDEICKQINLESSPVGIDAVKTHVLIIYKLIEIEKRLDQLENNLIAGKAKD